MLLVCAVARSSINGPPIQDNNYNLDLRQGPVIGSARQVALGGAYIGVAEGIASLNSNPAGVAFRLKRSKTKFDWDWTAGVNNLESNDFDNNGYSPPIYSDHRIRSLGIMGQYGAWGLGVLSNGEILAMDGPDGQENEYVLNATSFALGRQFLEQQLTMGLGLRATLIKIQTSRYDTTLGKISGVGMELGVVWHPRRGPFRFGANYSSAIKSNQNLTYSSSSPVTVNGLIIPKQAVLPARMGAGLSYETVSAPFWKGHKWLVASDVLFTAPSENAVGVESVLDQKQQPIGTHTTASLRAGTEVETWPGRLRLRLGSYYEPSYFAEAESRTHVTGGFEVRLFHTSIWGEYDWGLTCTVDSARDYLNQFISLGFWYF